MASRYQYHIVLEIHLQIRYVIEGPEAATSGRVGTGMETCKVKNEVALGPLFLVLATHKLCLLRFACVLKSLCDALSYQCFQKQLAVPFTVYHRCSPYLRIFLLGHVDLAEYMGHVFGELFGLKHARFPKHSSNFDNAVLPIQHKFSQAESFRRHVRAHD